MTGWSDRKAEGRPAPEPEPSWAITRKVSCSLGERIVRCRVGQHGNSSIDFEITASGEPDLKDLRTEFYGHLKFDGCFNWQTTTNYMAHTCEPEELMNLMTCFHLIRTVGRDLMPGACY